MKAILFEIFKTSLEEVVFPEKLQIAKVIAIFKKGEEKNVENYQPVEHFMYNRLYKYFINNNLLHKNQFAFQINNSTKHATLQFTRDIAQKLILANLH